MFARKVFFYLFANYIQQFLGFFTSLAIRKFIAPFDFGIWTTVKMVMRYSEYSNLGVFAAISKEVPYYIGKKDYQKVNLIKDVSGTFIFWMLCIVSTLLFTASFVVSVSEPLKVGLRVASVIFFLTFIFNLYLNLLRAYNNFNALSKIIVVNSVLIFILYIPLSYFWHLEGLYVAVVLSLIGSLAYTWYTNREVLQFYFIAPSEELRKITFLLKIGIGLIAVGFVHTVFLTSEKWVIVRFLGFEYLGYYSIAILASEAITVIPKLISHISFTEMQNVYGEAGHTKAFILKMQRYVSRLTLYAAYLIPIAIGFAYIWAEWLVLKVTPRYTPGITCMYIVLVASLFGGLSFFSYNLLVTLNKYLLLLPLLLLSTATIFVCSLFFIRQGWGLNGVAYATVIGYFLFFVIVSLVSLKNIHSLAEILILYVKIAGIVTYYLVLIMLCRTIRFPSRVVSLLVQTLVFSFGVTPIAIRVERRLQLLKKIMRGTQDVNKELDAR